MTAVKPSRDMFARNAGKIPPFNTAVLSVNSAFNNTSSSFNNNINGSGQGGSHACQDAVEPAKMSMSLKAQKKKCPEINDGRPERVFRSPDDPANTRYIHPKLAKPPISYAQLIINVIEESPTKCLNLNEIYMRIKNNHPYFDTASSTWKNSIRHNLSLNKAFVKIPRTDKSRGKNRGFLWGYNPNSTTTVRVPPIRVITDSPTSTSGDNRTITSPSMQLHSKPKNHFDNKRRNTICLGKASHIPLNIREKLNALCPDRNELSRATYPHLKPPHCHNKGSSRLTGCTLEGFEWPQASSAMSSYNDICGGSVSLYAPDATSTYMQRRRMSAFDPRGISHLLRSEDYMDTGVETAEEGMGCLMATNGNSSKATSSVGNASYLHHQKLLNAIGHNVPRIMEQGTVPSNGAGAPVSMAASGIWNSNFDLLFDDASTTAPNFYGDDGNTVSDLHLEPVLSSSTTSSCVASPTQHDLLSTQSTGSVEEPVLECDTMIADSSHHNAIKSCNNNSKAVTDFLTDLNMKPVSDMEEQSSSSSTLGMLFEEDYMRDLALSGPSLNHALYSSHF